MSIDRSGFALPNLDLPLDPAPYFEAVPDRAMAKGMFLNAMVVEVEARGRKLDEPKSYIRFKDYPMREFMELAVECARVMDPGASLRRGLFDLGHSAYLTFKESMVGKVMFAFAGDDPARVLRLANRAYAATLTLGSVELVEEEDTAGVIRFTDIYNFIDCYQLGVAQGLLEATGHRGTIKFRGVSLSEGYALLEWGD